MGPRRRRALLAVAALTLAACGRGDEPAASPLPTVQLDATTAVLAASVDRTVEVGSYNYAMIAEVGLPGFDVGVKLRATGSVDLVGDALSIEVDLRDAFEAFGDEPGANLAADMLGGGEFVMVVTRDAAYMDVSSFRDLLGVDTRWVQVPLDAGMLPTDGFGLGDPTVLVTELAAAGEVTEIGPDTVRGVPVTHFQVVLDPVLLADLGVGADLVGSAPLDVYIDAHGLIRRVQASFGAAAGGGFGGIEGGVAVELFDFGAGDPVRVPSPGDVTSLLGSGLLGGF